MHNLDINDIPRSLEERLAGLDALWSAIKYPDAHPGWQRLADDIEAAPSTNLTQVSTGLVDGAHAVSDLQDPERWDGMS